MAARLDVWDPKCSLGSPLERPNGGDTIYSDLMGLPCAALQNAPATWALDVTGRWVKPETATVGAVLLGEVDVH